MGGFLGRHAASAEPTVGVFEGPRRWRPMRTWSLCAAIPGSTRSWRKSRDLQRRS